MPLALEGSDAEFALRSENHLLPVVFTTVRSGPSEQQSNSHELVLAVEIGKKQPTMLEWLSGELIQVEHQQLLPRAR